MIEVVVSISGLAIALLGILWKFSSKLSYFATRLENHQEKFDCIEKDLPEIKKQLGEIKVRLEFHREIIEELKNDFRSFIKNLEGKRK